MARLMMLFKLCIGVSCLARPGQTSSYWKSLQKQGFLFGCLELQHAKAHDLSCNDSFVDDGEPIRFAWLSKPFLADVG